MTVEHRNLTRQCCASLDGDGIPHAAGCPVQAARDSFVEGMETRPTDMKRSIHRSHRGEGRNSIG